MMHTVKYSIGILARSAALLIILGVLALVSDTRRTPSEEAYASSEMWDIHRSLVRQRERLFLDQEVLTLEKRYASSDSTYAVFDLRRRRIFVKIHGLILSDTPLLSVDVAGWPAEGKRVREFVAGGWVHRSEEEIVKAASDSSLVARWGFWDLPLEPEGLIRAAARAASPRSSGIAERLREYGRRMVHAAMTILSSGRPDEEVRLIMYIRCDDTEAMVNAIPTGSRVIVVR